MNLYYLNAHILSIRIQRKIITQQRYVKLTHSQKSDTEISTQIDLPTSVQNLRMRNRLAIIAILGSIIAVYYIETLNWQMHIS